MPTQGVLAQKEMPNFSVMGLLLGGRGYASGWFQQRDRLAMVDAAIAKDRSDRATFAQGVMADPRWKNYLKNPNDRAAQGSLWELLQGGPESTAQLGNSLLTQGIGAIQTQELAGLQHTYQSQEQQQGHEFRLLEQTHGTNEALRQQQQLNALKLEQMKAGYDYVSKPLPDGMTAEAKQFAINTAGEAAGYARQPGYDLVQGPNGGIIGQVPQKGTPERIKIEARGNALSNVQSLAAQHLWMLENNQVDSIAGWNSRVDGAMNYMRQIYEAGAMSADDREHYMSVLPKLKLLSNDLLSPDILGQKKEQLRAVQEYSNRDLEQFARSTLVPVSTYTADDWRAPKNFQPGEVPSQTEFNKARDAREKRLKELAPRAPSNPYAGNAWERGGQLPSDVTTRPSLRASPDEEQRIRKEMEQF